MSSTPHAPATGWSRWNSFRVHRSGADWVVDSLLFASALVYWLFYAVSPDYWPAVAPWFWPIDVGLGLALCFAMWWTRSNPVAVGLFGIVAGAVAITATFALVVVVFRLAMYARPRTSLIIVLVHIATALPYHAFLPLAGMDWITWFVVTPLIYVLAWSFGMLARARRLVLESARREAESARERLEDEAERARRAERERLAREMHDVLAHRVSLVSVHAGALEFRTAPGADDSVPTSAEIHRAAGVIRENAHLALEELGEVLTVLRDADVRAADARRPQPRIVDLPRLVAEARDAGQVVETDIDSLATELPAGVQRSVYRIVQEGLTNARKHAPGAAVRVAVDLTEESAVVRIVNPVPVGVTQSQIPGGRSGLVGLAERVRVEAGTLEHGVRGGEFELVAVLPRRRGAAT